MPPLTPRQRTVLETLRDLAREGRAPSLDALCAELGLRSRGSLHRHVQALVAAGLVAPMAGQHRGVHLTAAALGEDEALPLLGRIAAGRPIEAVTDTETVTVPPWLRAKGRCYVLEVRGDSMTEDGILDGDRIVVEHREQARNGELVVALVEGERATLKRLEQRPGEVVLHPANAAHAPQRYPPDQVIIQGVVVGQMRRY